MSPFKSIFAALALTLSTAAVAAPVATAQSEKVIVINSAQLQAESKAGKDVFNKLKTITQAISNELKPSQTSLTNDRNAFKAATQGKTPEQLRADASLKQQAENLQRKTNEYARKEQALAQELEYTRLLAMSEYQKALRVVALEEMKARGAQVILDSSQVLFADTAADVTESVKAKFDARTPTINVVRKKPPARPAQ